MKREGFSYRRTTTKKKRNMTEDEIIDAITGFFLDTRVFQLKNSDIAAFGVFNRDQVPMALASSYSTTIDDKNRDVIYDATFNAGDTKRFCTLNSVIPMETAEDWGNLI